MYRLYGFFSENAQIFVLIFLKSVGHPGFELIFKNWSGSGDKKNILLENIYPYCNVSYKTCIDFFAEYRDVFEKGKLSIL